MTEQMEGQVGLFDPDTWSGKTCPEHSVPTAGKTSRPSSRKSSASSNRTLPMCLCLIGADGARPGVSTPTWELGALLGEFTMHSFGEQPSMLMAECSFPELPSGVSVSRLSQILEDSAHPKYSLSAKACEGILRRAERRGKELPLELKKALEAQAGGTLLPEPKEAIKEQTSRILPPKRGKTVRCESCGEVFSSTDEINGLSPAECPRCGEEYRLRTVGNAEESEETAGGTGGGVEGAIGTISFQERGGKPGGGKGILIQRDHVGALSALSNQSVLAYGIDQQGGKGGANYTEDVCTPILSDSHGTPHAVAYGIGCDVYNQEVTGEVAASLTAASGGTNTSGPKVIAAGFSFGQSAKARSIGFEEEVSPTLRGGEGGNQKPCVICFNDQGGSVMGVSEDVTGALRAEEHGHQPIVYNGANITSEITHANPKTGDPCPTLSTDARNFVLCAGKEMHVYDGRGNGDGEICPTMTGDHQNRVTDYTALCVVGNDIAQTLDASYFKGPGSRNGKEREVVCVFDKEMYNCGERMTGEPQARLDSVAPTVRADSHPSGVCTSTVRRLTPLECTRLQGYPDGWINIGDWVDSKGKTHKDADSPKYKALGNSIATPFWFWLTRRISAQYERPATLGSLFDGIGGFPLCWERCNGKGTARWASEIEEFPIAVTKTHFPEEDTP